MASSTILKEAPLVGLLNRTNLADFSRHSFNRMPKKLMLYIEKGQISVQCGKVYKLDVHNCWNRYDEDWVYPAFAWLYKMNLISCGADGVLYLTRDYYIVMALVERIKNYSSTNF